MTILMTEGFEVPVERIEDVQYAEYMCPSTLRLIMVLTGRFRGHRLAIKTNADYDMCRVPRYKAEVIRFMKEELEFKAGTMTPARVEARLEEAVFHNTEWVDRILRAVRMPPEERDEVNWSKEGF